MILGLEGLFAGVFGLAFGLDVLTWRFGLGALLILAGVLTIELVPGRPGEPRRAGRGDAEGGLGGRARRRRRPPPPSPHRPPASASPWRPATPAPGDRIAPMATPATLVHASRRKAVVADLLLFSVAVFWGANFVFIKSAVERTTAIAAGSIVAGTMLYLLLRYVVATGIFAAAQPSSWLNSSRRDWGMGSLLGAFYLTALILQTIGLQRTSPGVSGFITGLSVAMVPFLYWAVARRSPGRWQIVGAVVAFVGLGLLSLRGDFTLSWGDSITLLGTLFYALHIMTTGFFAPKVRPTTLALTQMAVLHARAGRDHAVRRTPHARPALAGVGRRSSGRR